MKKIHLLGTFSLLFIGSFQCTKETENNNAPIAQTLSPVQLLGEKIFFDSNLSQPIGQSCASCHAASAGFADPRKTAVSEGASLGVFGTRNTPSAAYAAFAPFFHYDVTDENYIGGLFWDGRAATLSEQAGGPLMNHLEMNNGTKNELLTKLKHSDYRNLFLAVYGPNSLNNSDSAFEYMSEAIEEYEESPEFSPFTSKFDYYTAGRLQLTSAEKRGLSLFNDSLKGNCSACHPSTPDALSGQILFTDYTYDNLGVPVNTRISPTEVDLGLGKIVSKSTENGKFKVPTLRNVAITSPYFHNGIYTTLEEVMDFYNTRDKGQFGIPEVQENVNHDELGNLELSDAELSDIIAFLKTLTDGYQLEK